MSRATRAWRKTTEAARGLEPYSGLMMVVLTVFIVVITYFSVTAARDAASAARDQVETATRPILDAGMGGLGGFEYGDANRRLRANHVEGRSTRTLLVRASIRR